MIPLLLAILRLVTNGCLNGELRNRVSNANVGVRWCGLHSFIRGGNRNRKFVGEILSVINLGHQRDEGILLCHVPPGVRKVRGAELFNLVCRMSHRSLQC